MSANPKHLRLIETASLPPEDDDLSGMAGLFNGLAITFAFYALVFVAWWLW